VDDDVAIGGIGHDGSSTIGVVDMGGLTTMLGKKYLLGV